MVSCLVIEGDLQCIYKIIDTLYFNISHSYKPLDVVG